MAWMDRPGRRTLRGRTGLLALGMAWAAGPGIAAAALAIAAAAQESGPHATAGPGAATATGSETDRYPGGVWMQYADVSAAGFSPEALARARRFWEHRGAAAFLAVSHGAVVAAWGDVDRRFPIHSMRKSLLSVLYGVFADDIDLGMTLDELGIDDVPPLTDQEQRARVVDLISAQSGVYHSAAAEPAEMSESRPERGSHAPGTYWWYNNWDFNAAGAVFERQTGTDIFRAFDSTIARPIGMQDFRLMDGYHHVEPDKSVHTAYLFRMSTRDLARLGLLLSRGGRWGGRPVIPGDWVAESTRAHSDMDMGKEYGTGYGYMWWVDGDRSFSALGYGGHALAVYPGLDLVLVVRADTYHDRFVSMRAIARLFGLVVDAGGGPRAEDPRLVPLPPTRPPPPPAGLPAEQLARYVGMFELEGGRRVTVASSGGALTVDYGMGVYRLVPESDARFHIEDMGDPVLFGLDSITGRATGVFSEQLAYLEAGDAVRRGSVDDAVAVVRRAAEAFPESPTVHYNLAKALAGTERPGEALEQLRAALQIDPEYDDAQRLKWRLEARRYAWLAAALAAVVAALWLIRRVRRPPTAERPSAAPASTKEPADR